MRKRNVSRRQFLHFAGSAAGMAALAACVAPAAAPAESGASMDEAGPTPTPGRMAAEDRSVQLELFSVWGGLLFNEWINAVEIYEESHPDVGVTVTFAPGHGDNPKLLTAVAGGIAPDMAMIVDFSTAQWVELGVMSDLTPYFDAAGLSGDDYWPAAWYLMNYKGKVWQMPFDVDPNFPIFWNKGIFEEVGLDPETGPVTIDDVDAFSQEINRVEDGVATRIGMIPWQTYGFGNSIYTWGWAFGGSFYDEANEEVTPDDEHIVASLQWMVDTAKAVGGPDQVSVTPPGLQVHYFGGGNVGMSPMVSVNFRDVKRYNPDLQIGQGLGCIRDFCISPWV